MGRLLKRRFVLPFDCGWLVFPSALDYGGGGADLSKKIGARTRFSAGVYRIDRQRPVREDRQDSNL